MRGKTKVVVVDLNNPYDDIKVGDTGYIDGYVTEKGGRHFAIVVFENGDIKPVHISRLRALEELL